MSTPFYDLASLVVVPSGYKTSKVYAQKPLTTDGQLAFTRSTTATRVASNGLIEKVRTNVALYSEDLTNAAYTKNRSSITANALVNPVNGATTADYIVETATTGTHEAIQTFIVSSGISYTISVYAKADTRTKIALVLAGSAFASGGNGQAIFNLSTGAVISAINGATAQISDAGNGWYRCSITKASIDTAGVIALELVDASDNTSYTGDGTSRAAFFGAQLEVSDFGATPYIATTTAAVSVGPVANVPRLDYLNSSCPRLLLEGQRQNILNFSESFDNAYWNKAGTTITANNTTSPDGYTNADRLTSSGAGNDEYVQRAGLSTTAGTYTSSIFVKNVNATQTVLMAVHLGEGSITSDLRYTWSTGAVTTSGTNAVSGKATSYGNGWVRLEFTYTIGASVTGHWFRTYVQTGVSTNSIFIYGASVELGAYATSYIPTLGAAVTRGADACSKTGISSLIGQTEGTLFGEFTFTGISPTMHLFSSVAGSFGNAIYVQTFSATGISMQVWTGVVNQVAINKSGLTVGQNVKFAAAYKNNDFVLYVNGVQAGTDTSGTVPSGLSQLEVGGYAEAGSPFNFNSPIKQAIVFPVRLSNSDLAALTA